MMREIAVRLERHYQATPEALWDLIINPHVSAQFQSKATVTTSTGMPGTVGFVYSLRADRGGRTDRFEVVEAEAPRLLREQVRSDLLAASALGQLLHPSEQLTVLEPDGRGTMLRWQLTTPAPWWASTYMKWDIRRAVAAILEGIAEQAEAKGR